MKQFVRLIVGAVAGLVAWLSVVSGCQRSGGATAGEPVPAPYRADIARLCDVVVQSGASAVPAGERAPMIATWLGGHLETRQAHDYLIRIQPLTGEPKAAALEAEARRVGLPGCALAAEWRTATPGQ